MGYSYRSSGISNNLSLVNMTECKDEVDNVIDLNSVNAFNIAIEGNDKKLYKKASIYANANNQLKIVVLIDAKYNGETPPSIIDIEKNINFYSIGHRELVLLYKGNEKETINNNFEIEKTDRGFVAPSNLSDETQNIQTNINSSTKNITYKLEYYFRAFNKLKDNLIIIPKFSNQECLTLVLSDPPGIQIDLLSSLVDLPIDKYYVITKNEPETLNTFSYTQRRSTFVLQTYEEHVNKGYLNKWIESIEIRSRMGYDNPLHSYTISPFYESFLPFIDPEISASCLENQPVLCNDKFNKSNQVWGGILSRTEENSFHLLEGETAPNWVTVCKLDTQHHNESGKYFSYRSFNLCLLYIPEKASKKIEIKGQFYLTANEEEYTYRVAPYVNQGDGPENKEKIEQQKPNKIEIYWYVCSLPTLHYLNSFGWDISYLEQSYKGQIPYLAKLETIDVFGHQRTVIVKVSGKQGCSLELP